MKRLFCLVLVAVMILSFSGCKSDDESDDIKVFYLNIDATSTESLMYELKSKGEPVETQVDELLEQLNTEPNNSKLRRTIPEEVVVLNHQEKGYTCNVDFSKAYYGMTAAEEILMRASVVRTLAQLESIEYISFTVESAPLVDSDGNVVGSMNQDDFVENPGAQINSSVKETLTLYFADEGGTTLKKQTREIHYSSNISLEKLVIEQLIEGPKGRKLKETLPSTTRLINISVVDGICYLNFDSTFRNGINNELTEDVVLYSIVNSLTSLATVDKVQISINGENEGNLLYNYKLSEMYEFNEKLVSTEEK